MKKMVGLIVVTVVSFVFAYSNPGYTFTWGKKKEAEPQKAAEQKGAKPEVKEESKKEVKKDASKQAAFAVVEEKKVDPKKLEQDRMLRQKKREQLDNSLWDIDINTMSGKEKPKKDALIFEGNKVSSDKFAKEGFAPTNYTLTVQGDGVTVWETMQTAANGQIIFWRGEIEPKMTSMRGVISKHVSNEKTEDYSFVSQERRGITPKK